MVDDELIQVANFDHSDLIKSMAPLSLSEPRILNHSKQIF